MITKFVGVAALAAALICMAAPAAAKPKEEPKANKDGGSAGDGTPCGLNQIVPGASACQGWFAGNLNGGDLSKRQASASALNALLGVNSFTASNLTFLEDISSLSGNVIDFGTPLFGNTVFSFHVGGANGEGGLGYNATAFFRFDAGNLAGGLDTITLNVPGLSNARLYSTEAFVSLVPEPASWALMIVGLGAVGVQIRRRRRRIFVVSA